MATYGRIASSNPDFGIISPGVMRGYTPDALSQNGWVTSMGGDIGRNTGTTPSCRFGLFAVSGSLSPTDRLAYTASVSPSTLMTDGTQGANVTANIQATTNSPKSTAQMVYAGEHYHLAVTTISASLGHGMIQSASISGDNESFYEDSGLSSTIPPSTFDVNTSFIAGWMTIWATYTPNTKPRCTITSPSGTITDFSPSIAGTFADDETGLGDCIDQVKIQVVRSDNVVVWDPGYFGTSSSNKESDTWNELYNGPALTAGASYKVHARVSDQFGTFSDYSAYSTFTVSSAGTVAMTSPTGKQEANTGLSFVSTWTHATGLAMTNARIALYQNGIKTQESAWIAKAAASGASFTITQAEAGITLTFGQTYEWAVIGRDTLGGESTYKTSGRPKINLDTAPTIPASLTPANNAIKTTLPMITADVTDIDDTNATGLTADARIKAPYLVTNGGFVGNVTGWTAATIAGITKTFTYDAATFVTAAGSGKLQITANTAGIGASQFVTADQKQPCVVGQSYTARAVLRTDNLNITPRLIIEWYTVADVFISRVEETDYAPTINAFSARVLTAVAPATASYFKIGWDSFCDTANPLGSTWGEDFSIDDGTRYTRAMTYQSLVSTNKYRFGYTLTATDVPAVGIVRFDTSAFDGTLYSATPNGTTAVTSRQWSAEAAFQFAVGPTIVVTAPANGSTITTNTPAITWTFAGGSQASATVNIYDMATYDDDPTPIHTGTVVGAGLTYTPPAGILKNTHVYRFIVTGVSSIPTTGTSDPVDATLTFTPPPQLPLSATPRAFPMDGTTPTAILLSWPRSTDANFRQYRILKRQSNQSPDRAVVVVAFTSVYSTSYEDHEVASGIEYTYSLLQTIAIGGDEVDSTLAEATGSVTFPYLIIHSINDPDGRRIVHRYWALGRPLSHVIGGAVRRMRNQDRPVIAFGPGDSDTLSVTAQFITDEGGAARDYYLSLRRLTSKKGDMCLRDPRGELWYGALIGQVNWKYTFGQSDYEADWTFQQSDYDPGVPA